MCGGLHGSIRALMYCFAGVCEVPVRILERPIQASSSFVRVVGLRTASYSKVSMEFLRLTHVDHPCILPKRQHISERLQTCERTMTSKSLLKLRGLVGTSATTTWQRST